MVSEDDDSPTRGVTSPYFHIATTPLLAEAKLERTDAERERSDVADLERHLHQNVSWADSRILPPMPGRKIRSSSFNEPAIRRDSPELAEPRRLRQPGGFRRGHLDKKADIQGIPLRERSKRLTVGLVQHLAGSPLELFDVDIYEHQFGRSGAHEHKAQQQLSGLGLVFTVFKAGMGSGVLFQARAWKSGGYVLSTMLLPVIAGSSVVCALRLIHVRNEGTRGSYGDLMYQALGRPGCIAINTSIFLLETGACCSYMALTAQTLSVTLLPLLSVPALIAGTMIILTPLALIRQVSRLRIVNIIGTTLTLVGVFFVLISETWQLYSQGVVWHDVVPVKPDGVLVFAGMACFTFEGIGCVVPVYDSAAKPHEFPLVYKCVMSVITLINVSVALLGYLAFGEDTQPVILLNLPQGIAISMVKLAMAGAVVCTFPLALLPALRIAEEPIFGKPVSNPPFAKKCKKNVFRSVFVAGLAVVTVVGSTSLDNFVSIVGAFCGIPLAFVFPAIIHLCLVKDASRRDKLVDVVLIIACSSLALIITVKNLMVWGQS